MEGMVRAANRETDLGIVTAWYTAMFGLSGYAGSLKGKKLSDFLSSAPTKPQRSVAAEAVAFFHSLKGKGVDVKITRH